MKTLITDSTESINTVDNSNNLSEKQLKSIQKELRPVKENMYDFINHTWNPIKGKCQHECGYCYVSRLVKNQKEIRLDDKAMKADLGTGNFIFVGSGTDVFAESVSSEWVTKVLDYCNKFNNKYLFQSKNPERFKEFIKHPVFKKSVICTTIESNRLYADCKAPSVEERVSAIEVIKSEMDIDAYVTIEPIMDFDLKEMVELIKRCSPTQVNIGADSKRTALTEPTREKASELIVELKKFTTVNEKKNLNRLMKIENPMNKELALAKEQTVTSEMMKVQIREKSDNGYTYKEGLKKFGLIKENRQIKPNEVHKFTQKIQNGKYDPELQPIVTIEAHELLGKYNITDLAGKPIPEPEIEDYLIVIDGQHRVSAFTKLNSVRPSEDKITIPDVLIKKDLENIKEFLAELNTVGHNWNTSDKMCVAAIATEDKTLLKIHELIKIGFNASAAIYMCTGGKRFNPKQMNDILAGNTSCLPKESGDNLLIAEKFVIEGLAIEKMTAKILSKRYFVRGFLSFIEATSKNEAFTALKKLNISHFEKVNDELIFIQNLKAV